MGSDGVLSTVLVSALTAAVTSSVVGAVLRYLGKAWIEHRFAKAMADFNARKNAELEGLKSDYQHQTELLRARAGRFLDKAVKLNTREFEVLPEAWSLCQKALGATMDLTRSLKEYPDLDSMSKPELDYFLEGSDIAPWQKEEIRNTPDRISAYRRFYAHLQFTRARKAHLDFNNYLVLNEIFIDKALGANLRAICDNLLRAQSDHQLAYDGSVRSGPQQNSAHLFKEAASAVKEASRLSDEIGLEIRERLFDVKKALND